MLALPIVLITLGAAISLLNWAAVVASHRSECSGSAVPLIGGILLAAGMLSMPETRPFAWVAPILDCGTLGLILALPGIVHQIRMTRAANLVHEFQNCELGRHIRIRMYRSGVAVISAVFDPPVPRDDRGSLAASFSWQGRWIDTDTGYSVTDYGSARQLLIFSTGAAFQTRELHCPVGSAYAHDSLDSLDLTRRN